VLVIGSRGDNKAQDAEVIDEDKKYLPEGNWQLSGQVLFRANDENV